MNQTIPTLTTERLILRPFTIADAEDVARFVGEKVIAANTLSIPHPYELQMAEDWIATHAQSYLQSEGVNFAITVKEHGDLVGAIGLTLQREHDRAEMGYWIGKPHWNKGYASEAACKIVEFGFESRNLERIYAQHFAENPASGKVMRNAGMRYEGCLRHHVKKWERYQDLKVYGLLRSEWLGDD
jgi:RimJ/RimL family protein N-acetyltransferase